MKAWTLKRFFACINISVKTYLFFVRPSSKYEKTWNPTVIWKIYDFNSFLFLTRIRCLSKSYVCVCVFMHACVVFMCISCECACMCVDWGCGWLCVCGERELQMAFQSKRHHIKRTSCCTLSQWKVHGTTENYKGH